MKRRTVLGSLVATCALPTRSAVPDSLAGEIGVTTGSFMRHLSSSAGPGKLRLLDLPRRMHDELGLRVIDLMTATLAELSPAYCDKLRAEAERQGCLLTNLKMNQKGLDLGSEDKEVRGEALRVYQETIDLAAILGVRWVRPLPMSSRPDLSVYAGSYRELIDYAGERGIGVLVENFGWMMGDPDAIPRLIDAVGPGLKSQPDTGNWSDNEVRYVGLEKAFPHAVSCDFKARALGPDGSHAEYDLKRCFDIGWGSGFRGPWCFEHFHDDLDQCFKEMAVLCDLLRGWMKEAG